MSDVSVGTVRATGDTTGLPAVGETIAVGNLVSRVNGLLYNTVATDQTKAKNCIGIAVEAFTPGANKTATAGQKIAIGDEVALRKAGSVWRLFKRLPSETSVGKATTAGIIGQTVTYAQPAKPIAVATRAGSIVDFGVSLTAKTFYVASSTAGKICPLADLSTNEYFTLVGWGDANGDLVLNVTPYDNKS